MPPDLTLRRAACAVTVAVTMLLAGCGTVVSGDAVRAPIDPAAPVDPALLDTANYPTTPMRLGAAGSPGIGRLIDAQRMLDYVTGPWEVDPSLVEVLGLQPQVVALPSGLTMRVDSETIGVADRLGAVNAVYTGRKSQDRDLSNVIFRFPDPAAATTAAAEMATAVLPTPLVSDRVAGVPIPRHPGTAAVSAVTPGVPGKPSQTVLEAFTARGIYVLHQSASTTTVDDTGMPSLVADVLDRQGPLIDQFVPTAAADFAGLPRDPSGLMARTLPLADKDSPTTKGVYDRRAAVHFQTDPIRAAALFDTAGVSQMATADANVYEAADPEGAAAVVESFGEEVAKYPAADPVPNLPGSRCVEAGEAAYCLAAAGRYAIEIQGPQLKDVHHRVAAQYVMLTSP